MLLSFSYRLAMSAALAAALFGCSVAYQGNLAASQLDAEVKSANKTAPDISVERNSEAMRRFLMAELSMEAEEPEDALDNLKTSSQLVNVPDPQIQLNLAKLYLGKGDPVQALAELDSVFSDPQALALRAALLQTLGQESESLEVYRQLLLVQPDHVEARLMLSLAAIQQGHTAEAVPLLEGVLVKDGKNMPTVKLLAFSCRELGNFEKSLNLLDIVRQIDPGDSNAFKSLLSIALENQKYSIIELELQREARLSPSNPILAQFASFDWKNPESGGTQALLQNLRSDSIIPPSASDLRYELARQALLRQNFSEAVIHFSLLLAEKPKDDELRYTLALALSSSGKSRESIAHLDSLESDSPWFVRAQAFAGMLHRQNGDYKSAEQSFRRAIKVEPKSEQLNTYLASVLREARKFDAARSVYQEMLKSDPANQKVLFSYGTLLYEMKQTKESHEILQRLIGLNPQHAEALNFVAYSLAEEDRELERALDLANRAMQIQPENGFFLDTRGWVYFKMGRHNEAVTDLELAVDLTKSDAEISEHLADVYLKAGRKKDALKVYKVALDNLVDSKEENDKVSAQRIKSKIEKLSR